MTALWVACPAVEVERDTVDVSTEIKPPVLVLQRPQKLPDFSEWNSANSAIAVHRSRRTVDPAFR
jgi:hypothetical protein